ncbi:MAG TPA: ABC transporter permease, partial [Phycisphaerales bacterium]|nr:ABC transporter permease [Phycisphaerales bacterium]
ACGVGPVRTFWQHLLPNLVGPIVVYATLTIPNAILQESFLSFLGIGVQAPMPSWGNLAAEGTEQLASIGLTGTFTRWWLLVWPCTLLGLTLMGLNFVGDALRDKLDPRTRTGHR